MVERTFEEQQVSALIALRASFDSHGANLDWWPAMDSTQTTKQQLQEFCDFVPGVVCHQQQKHVVTLNWNVKDLMGTIPSEIGYLTMLERLSLGNNDLHGTLPESLANLSFLEHLELHRNDFSGSLPGSLWTNMTVLRRLLVQSNHFAGTLSENLCSLTSLHGLDIFGNPLTGTIPECLGSLALKTFQLHDTYLTGTIPSELCQQTSMNDVESSSGTVGCDAIACPEYTYESVNGRQSSDDSSCQPCPTALYLGSTTCPEATGEPRGTMTPTPTNMPTAPSSTQAPTNAVRGGLPTTVSWGTFYPSTGDPTPPATTMHPSVVDVTDQPTWGNSQFYDNGTNHPSSSGTYDDLATFTTGPTLSPADPPHAFDYTPSADFYSPPNEIPDVHSSQSSSPSNGTTGSTNWTLLAAACMLSALAMLTVVWARRNGRQWWHVKQRQQLQHQRLDTDPDSSDEQPKEIPSAMVMPAAAGSLTPKRRPPTPVRENSFRSVSTRSCCYLGSSILGPATTNGKLEDDEDDSIESDSGWNDTVSSVDDDDDDASFSMGAFPSCVRPSTAYFPNNNDLVPV